MNIARHVPKNVLPLEVWDLLVEGGPLYLRAERDVPRGVVEVVAALTSGDATRLRANLRLPKLSIDEVVLAGGGPVDEAVALLRRAGYHARSDADPIWIGARGGRAFLGSHGFLHRVAVMEVGQTSIKYSDDDGRVRISRSFQEVPLEVDVRHLPLAEVRARTVAFFASVPSARDRPHALVLALPCEIEADLRVAGCSYPWAAGDASLIRDILEAADLCDTPCWVVNDAELAAMTVALERDPSKSTLVLTLGLGLGGAYLPRL